MSWILTACQMLSKREKHFSSTNGKNIVFNCTQFCNSAEQSLSSPNVVDSEGFRRTILRPFHFIHVIYQAAIEARKMEYFTREILSSVTAYFRKWCIRFLALVHRRRKSCKLLKVFVEHSIVYWDLFFLFFFFNLIFMHTTMLPTWMHIVNTLGKKELSVKANIFQKSQSLRYIVYI